MRNSEDMLRLFLESGQQVDEAVAAFGGTYPFGGGYSSLDFPFSRPRALARIDGTLEVWTAQRFGGRPVVRIAEAPIEEFTILREGGRYERVALAGKRFWVHHRHRAVIEKWATP